jgi:hypothetical protein
MTKIKFSILFALILTNSVAALATGYVVEDGAGGIIGQTGVITVSEGKIPFLAKPEAMKDIPGLQETFRLIAEAPIAVSRKAMLLAALIPGPTRTYHRVTSAAQSSEVVNHRLPGLKIFAISDARGNTVLLPSFYQLPRPTQQSYALLRAALTSLKTSAGLALSPEAKDEEELVDETIFDAAKLFQLMLENPRDPDTTIAFYSQLSRIEYFNNFNFSLYGSLAFDLKYNAAFSSQGGRILMKDVFGGDFLNCWFTQEKAPQSCSDLLAQTGSRTATLATGSLFVRALPKYFGESAPRQLMPVASLREKYHLQDPAARARFLDHFSFSLDAADSLDSLSLKLFYDDQAISQLRF